MGPGFKPKKKRFLVKSVVNRGKSTSDRAWVGGKKVFPNKTWMIYREKLLLDGT